MSSDSFPLKPMEVNVVGFLLGRGGDLEGSLGVQPSGSCWGELLEGPSHVG